MAFNRNSLNEWVLTWFTHQGGRPTWYLSRNGLVSSNGYWSAQLYSYWRNPITGVQTEIFAGTARVQLKPTSS